MTDTAKPADFYDRALTGDGARAMAAAEDSPWLPVYLEVAGWLYGAEPLVDLGCGTGRFAATAAARDHSGSYHGIDFAPSAIAEAARYVADVAPEYEATFTIGDLRSWHPDEIRPGATTFVCLEVLEHLDDDVALIERVPSGHRFLFSVPNYGSASHVRRFPAPHHVWDRYGDLLSFRRWTLINVGDGGHAIHVLDATRRTDSWR